eukprot:5640836-Lingulodinium_polyedra.AAC.1
MCRVPRTRESLVSTSAHCEVPGVLGWERLAMPRGIFLLRRRCRVRRGCVPSPRARRPSCAAG